MGQSRKTRAIRKALDESLRKADEWLAPSGLSVQCETEEPMPPDVLGEYEACSVYEKQIHIWVNIPGIAAYCYTGGECPPGHRWDGLREIVATTVYHEVGHAVVEQIRDWDDNIPEIRSLVRRRLRHQYNDVFDGLLDEEVIVEDFAWGMLEGRPSQLQRCFEDLNRFIENDYRS